MPREMTAGALSAAAALEGYAFFYLAELSFDSAVREDPGNIGFPDTHVRWKVEPPSAAAALLIMEASLDGGFTWVNLIENAASNALPWSIDLITGEVETPIPDIEIGEALHGRQLLLRQTFMQDHVRLVSTEVEIIFDTVDDLAVPHSVLRTEATLSTLQAGSHRGTIAWDTGPKAVVQGASQASLRFLGLDAYAKLIPATADALWVASGERVNVTEDLVTTEVVTFTNAEDASFTLEFWARFDSLTGTEFILGWFNDNLLGTGVYRTADGKIGVNCPQFTTGNLGGRFPQFSSLLREENFTETPAGVIDQIDRWYHIAVVYDGFALSIFIDRQLRVRNVIGGQSADTKDVWHPAHGFITAFVNRKQLIPDTRGDIWIGKPPAQWIAKPTTAFRGHVDEIRVYASGLSFSEIVQRMFRPLSAADIASLLTSAGLAGYWKLDEGALYTLNDSSGELNHGTIIEESVNGVEWAHTNGWFGRLIRPDNVHRSYRISPALDLGVAGNTINVTNAPFDIAWDSKTWRGVGNLAGVSGDVSETGKLEPRGITLILSGLQADFLAIALQQQYVDRPMLLFGVFFDANNEMVPDPVEIFGGRMDTMPIEIGRVATVGVTCESRLIDWERPSVRRWNDTDQRSRYPNDKGLEFIAVMADRQIWWPARAFDQGPS